MVIVCASGALKFFGWSFQGGGSKIFPNRGDAPAVKRFGESKQTSSRDKVGRVGAPNVHVRVHTNDMF